jgi:3-dehydroquinate synthase
MTISSRLRDYTVHFEADDGFVAALARVPQRAVVVDETVWRLHRGGALRALDPAEVIPFAVSEERKTLGGVTELYDALLARSPRKNLTLVSIGGGIVQDVTGFVASTLYRGVNWIYVPTTLLAQADSCVGSKTSLNHHRYKNLLGTFYPPAQVHIHAPFLHTLSDDDLRSGLGEVVKLHLMGGAEAAAWLGEQLPALLRREPTALLQAIHRSLAVKRTFMEGDEFDQGRRNLLNFGHCFGHALETVTAYAIPHGQAVVVGMLFADLAAVARGLLLPATAAVRARSVLRPALSVRVPALMAACDGLLAAMQQDKKRLGTDLVVVMQREDLELEKHTDFTPEELRAALGPLDALLSGP